MAIVQAIYCLPGRQTQGFLQSLFEVLKIDLRGLDHSTLSRQFRRLNISLAIKKSSNARHLVVDSTGVKVYGEGEWKVRQQGWSKRRTWLKLHLCADEATLEIISALATTNNVADSRDIESFSACQNVELPTSILVFWGVVGAILPTGHCGDRSTSRAKVCICSWRTLALVQPL